MWKCVEVIHSSTFRLHHPETSVRGVQICSCSSCVGLCVCHQNQMRRPSGGYSICRRNYLYGSLQLLSSFKCSSWSELSKFGVLDSFLLMEVSHRRGSGSIYEWAGLVWLLRLLFIWRWSLWSLLCLHHVFVLVLFCSGKIKMGCGFILALCFSLSLHVCFSAFDIFCLKSGSFFLLYGFKIWVLWFCSSVCWVHPTI